MTYWGTEAAVVPDFMELQHVLFVVFCQYLFTFLEMQYAEFNCYLMLCSAGCTDNHHWSTVMKPEQSDESQAASRGFQFLFQSVEHDLVSCLFFSFVNAVHFHHSLSNRSELFCIMLWMDMFYRVSEDSENTVLNNSLGFGKLSGANCLCSVPSSQPTGWLFSCIIQNLVENRAII